MKYVVYYYQLMKTTVEASTDEQAKEIAKKRIQSDCPYNFVHMIDAEQVNTPEQAS